MPEVGEKIGNIRLVERLGRGGIGEVYAGYDEKLRREVAVKMIRGDRVDLDSHARFLLEARVLSRLEHPNICKIYDYVEGEDNDFLILEKVRGRTLRQAEGLGREAKLRIAAEIARALAAAHARGVVHRDLKPSNVMLVGPDEEGVKVLDFGLARLVDTTPEAATRSTVPEAATRSTGPEAAERNTVSEAAEDGTLTRLAAVGLRHEKGVVSGTPAYMSPEQARGERVTAASDLYSFGILLQELFTGSGAYRQGLSAERLLLKAAAAETLPVEGVERELAGLIEALEAPAPEERPSAAAALERIEKIRDRPRRLRRNLLAAGLAALLLGGAAKYTIDLRRERNEAVTARRAEAAAREEAEEVAAFLTRLFESADAYRRPEGIHLRDVLEEGARRIETLAGRPELHARLLLTVGKVYGALGDSKRALELLGRAREESHRLFGPDSRELRDSLHGIAGVHDSASEYEKAEGLYREALAIAERADPGGSGGGALGALVKDFGSHYMRRGELQEAEPYLLRALELEEGGDPVTTSETLHNLGHIAYDREALGEAEALYLRALELSSGALGEGSTHAATVLNSLAQLELQQGRPAEAQAYLGRAREGLERSAEPDYPLLIQVLHNEAGAVSELGDNPRAAELYARVAELRRESQGPEHPELAVSLGNLATVLRRMGRYAEAEREQRRAVEIWRRAVGASHPNLAGMQLNLARILLARGRAAGAEGLLREALEILEKTVGPEHGFASVTHHLLGDSALAQGRQNEAETFYGLARDATRKRLAASPESHRERLRLAEALRGLGKLAAARGEGERAADHWYEAWELLAAEGEAPGLGHLHTRALLLVHLGRPAEARPLVAELLEKSWREPEFDRLAAPLAKAAARGR